MLIFDSLEYKVLPVPFHVLTLCGLWCPDLRESWLRQVYLVFTYFIVSAELILTVEVIIKLIVIIYINEFELDVFFITTSLINGLYKGLNILRNRNHIVNLLTKGYDKRWRVPRDDLEKQILKDYFSESW